MSGKVISPEVANNRQVSNANRSQSTKEELAQAIANAAQAQRDGDSSILQVAIERGESAGEACRLAAMVTSDQRAAVLAALDSIIDASHNGIARNQRRQELRREIALSHLAGIVSLDGLPLGHAKALIGAFVRFDVEKGTCDTEKLLECRQVIGDYRAAPCDVKRFRAAVAAAIGKRPSGKRREKSLLDTLRGILADEGTSDSRRASIYAAHPELHPDFVDAAEVAGAIAYLAKMTRASQSAALAKVIDQFPEVLEAALQANLEAAEGKAE